MRKQMPALGAVTAIALTAAMVWQSRSGRVAMTLRLVPVALLLGTSSALAFDTSKLIQFGTLPFDDLTPVIAKSARLQQEINQALSEGNKEHRVVCLGMRFPGPWKNLGGVRVSPYTCDFGAKWLQIHATVRITDRHGRAFETITAKAMKNATNVSETNLNWEWTTECGTAAYCAWYVGDSAPAQDGPGIVAGVKDVANQLQLYLDYIAKTGGRPDFSTPPVSDLFARIFDLRELAALPPPKASDLPWLMDWTITANGAFKSILYFGIAPPPDPLADQAAIKRNAADYEDQEAVALSFMIRISARATQAMFLFMDQLTPAQRTPIRLEGFTKARVGGAETVLGALVTIAQGMKPANARLLSAAIRDTSDAWVAGILPGDRPTILGMLAKANDASKDDETRKNLAALGTALANAK
jgi:hypothetical protein